MVLRLMAIPAALVIGLFSGTTAKDDGTTREPETIIVKMVDKSATEYAFEPADITVRRGDIVRFVQTGSTPHNVEFKDVAEGRGDQPRRNPAGTVPHGLRSDVRHHHR